MADLDDRLRRLEDSLASQPPSAGLLRESRRPRLLAALVVVALGVLVGGAVYGVFAFRPLVGSNPGSHLVPSGAGASRGIDDFCYGRPNLPDQFKPFVACLFVENRSKTRMAVITAGTGLIGHGIEGISACSRNGGTEDLAAPWTIEVGVASDARYESDRVGYSFVGEPLARFSSHDVGGDGIVILRIVISESGTVTFEQLTEPPSNFTGKTC